MRKPPKYQLHKATGQARVWLAGRHEQLPGAFGSRESREAYERLIRDWERRGRPTSLVGMATVSQVGRAWLASLEARTRPVRDAARWSVEVLEVDHANVPASHFTAGHVEELRARMIREGYSLTTIGKRVAGVKRLFRWAARRGIVSAEAAHQVDLLEPIRTGEAGVIPPRQVMPADDAALEVVASKLPPTLAAMLRLQRLTGMRSGELVRMTWGEIDRSGEVWIYRPTRHKGTHRGRERAVLIGPQAQAILRDRERSPELAIFQPIEALRERWSTAKVHRRPGQRQSPRKTARTVGGFYTPASYYRAVRRVCDEEGIESFHPHQLRHAHGTEATELLGIEAAAAALGHADTRMTQVYAKLAMQRKRERQAREVAMRLG